VELVGESSGPEAGASVAGVGDIAGDGKPDFVVGAPAYDDLGASSVGAACVVLGGMF